MATGGNGRFKKLISKGLTGWEAGRLLLQEGLARRKGQQGLTDSDVEAVKKGLKDNRDIKDFNGLLDVGIAIDNIVLQAHMNALETSRRVSVADDILMDWFDDGRTRINLFYSPRIVTPKQYQELKAEHKKTSLHNSYPLDQVINWRAMELAPKEIKAKVKYPEDFEVESPDLYRQLYQQATEQIRKFVRSGTLEPNFFEGDFTKKEKKAIQALEAKVRKQALTEEEWAVLLQEKTFFTGEQLYRSGLPEWPRWIGGDDDFYDEEMDDYYQVAVIQAPNPNRVDERGYYKADPLSLLPRLITENYKGTAGEMLQTILGTVKTGIRHFLSLQAVIEEVSEVLGVGFVEDVHQWRNELSNAIDRFNVHLEAVKDQKHLPLLLSSSTLKVDPRQVEPIEISKLRPEPKTLKGSRENIATVGFGIMGEGWWRKKSEAASDGAPEQEVSSDEA